MLANPDEVLKILERDAANGGKASTQSELSMGVLR